MTKKINTCNDIKANWINCRWHIDDVREVRPELTDEQCRTVLRTAKRRHDANIGINWDVLAMWARDLFPEADDESEVGEPEGV